MSNKVKESIMKPDGKPTFTPKLRFPEFRDAAGWEEKRLDEVLTPIVREIKKPKEVYTGLGLRSHGKGTFLKSLEDPKKNAMEYLYEVKCDDLIVNITFAWEGAVAIACPSDDGALVSHRFPTYTFAKGMASPEFFKYIILDKHFVYNLGVISPGGAGRNRVLNKKDFLKLKVMLPDLKEQQKIVEFLTTVDETIAAQGRKLNTLESYKKALMQQLFPREGETQPRFRFPEFQNGGEWEEMPLSALVGSLNAGVSVNSGNRPATGDEIGILKTSAVTNGIFEPQENKVVFDEVEIARVKEPVQGDTIIISRMNTPALVGANAYVETSLENIFLPDRLWAVKPKPGTETSMRFVALILGSEKGRAALSKLATGSSDSMKNITKQDVLGFLIMAPPPAEQQHIANCFASLDDLIAAHTQKLSALKSHRNGLMQNLFPSSQKVEA
jgi:type I restriction enzyme S subunit